MTSLFGDADDGKSVSEPRFDFDSMESEEFFDDLVREAARAAGTTVEELDQLDRAEIDSRLGTEIGPPHHPRGAREGYRDTDRLDVVSRAELQRRRKRVNEELGL